MIKENRGNLLNVEEGIIVHGCNARGVMGSGVALQIKKKWKEAYLRYLDKCNFCGLRGKTHVPLGTIIPVQVTDHLMIINAITQKDYIGFDSTDCRRYVSYDAIEEAFNNIADLHSTEIIPIHFPLIGADRGRGNWNIIKTIIDETLPDEKFEKNLWILDK